MRRGEVWHGKWGGVAGEKYAARDGAGRCGTTLRRDAAMRQCGNAAARRAVVPGSVATIRIAYIRIRMRMRIATLTILAGRHGSGGLALSIFLRKAW